MFRTELNRTAVTRNGRDDSGPGVIESAFGLLEVLCALGRARVSDLTEESGLPRTTVYRLLGQLAAVGAVERVGAHYRLGASLLVLGQHVTPMEQLRTLAQRPMIELAAAAPVHVSLGTTTSGAPIYLDVIGGRERLPFHQAAGAPMPVRSAARACSRRASTSQSMMETRSTGSVARLRPFHYPMVKWRPSASSSRSRICRAPCWYLCGSPRNASPSWLPHKVQSPRACERGLSEPLPEM